MIKKIYYFKEDKAAFAAKFKELMDYNNLKLNDVVQNFDDMGTDKYEIIKKWRYGERLPDMDSISKLAEIFKTTMEDLYLSNSHYNMKKNRYSNMYNLDDNNLLNEFSYENIIKAIENNKAQAIEMLNAQADVMEEINYLLQKKLFSFLTEKEEKRLNWYFKYFILNDDYKKLDYDAFWNDINIDMINRMGKAYKYKITYYDMKSEYFEFKKKIIFAPNYHKIYIDADINDFSDDMLIMSYLARYDEVYLNALYTVGDVNCKIKSILKQMGCKQIKNYQVDDYDILLGVKGMVYQEYLERIEREEN